MPMYRAFAPFLEGDKGDRRVTGVGVHTNILVRLNLRVPGHFDSQMQDDGFKFSREFDAYLPPFDPKGAAFRLNSLENLTARWRVLTWNNGSSSEFGRGKQAVSAHSLIVGAHSCHPPVTLVTLKKGCRCPVYRHSVTLTPYFSKILCAI